MMLLTFVCLLTRRKKMIAIDMNEKVVEQKELFSSSRMEREKLAKENQENEINKI